MTELSVQHYLNRTSKQDVRPGAFSVSITREDPNVPLLPVCQSDYMRLSLRRDKHDHDFPCTCGNLYGDESDSFWRIGNWTHSYHIGETVNLCRKHFRDWGVVKHYPGAFMVNMCRMYYHMVLPNERKDHGHEHKNRKFCTDVLEQYEGIKDRSDEEINAELCKTWRGYHLPWGYYGFDQVNWDLKEVGCKKHK